MLTGIFVYVFDGLWVQILEVGMDPAISGICRRSQHPGYDLLQQHGVSNSLRASRCRPERVSSAAALARPNSQARSQKVFQIFRIMGRFPIIKDIYCCSATIIWKYKSVGTDPAVDQKMDYLLL